MAQDAQALLSEGTAERTLALSTRFSPLAGAQLANFGGFLDRPLREFDYYAGIYDGVHAAAVFACREQDPSEEKRPAPVRLPNSWELDLTQVETQRCVGAAMGQVGAMLGVPESEKAVTIVAALARAELAATLGSSARAEELLATAGVELGRAAGGSARARLAGHRQLRAALAEGALHRARRRGAVHRGHHLRRVPHRAHRARVTSPSPASMRLAVEDRAQFWRQTAQRGLDRATTIELTSERALRDRRTARRPSSPSRRARSGPGAT